MKSQRVNGFVVALLLGAHLILNPRAFAEKQLADVARDAFAEFQKHAPEMSITAKGQPMTPVVTAHPTSWECSDGRTLLIVDVRGNASYTRVPIWSPELPLTRKKPTNTANPSVDDGTLIQKTRQLATNWLPENEVRVAKPIVKHETLILAELPANAINELQGRTIIRLVVPDDVGDGSFQAVFDPKGNLLGLDIALANARTKDFCDRRLLASAITSKTAATEEKLTLGCFFDPSEYRFEICAYSVEGEPFINLKQASNPFSQDKFDLKLPHRVSVERYRGSQDYHWWCWTWWQHYGCVGGFRGNWLETDGKAGWEFPEHNVLHHRSLAAYPTMEGPPRHTKVIQQSDGPIEYPFAISQRFREAFYSDLEECNVAFLFSHGGPIQGVYQVRRGLDVWAVLAPPSRKLGVGKLRHLFLDGCSAFTFRREPESAHLVKTWIQHAPVNGVRTVCGVDGGASLLDRTGWRFFGHYNKGKSISDAWASALLDEYVENCPVTAAYGKSTGEAMESLLRGRFSQDKAQAKAVAFSIWSGTAKP